MQLITVWVRTGSLFDLSVSGQEVVASLQQLHRSKAPFVKRMTGKRERVQTHDGRYCSWAAWRSCGQRRVLFLGGDAIRRVGFRGELNNKKRKIGLQKQHEAVGSSSCSRPRRNARRGHASDCIQRIPWPRTARLFWLGPTLTAAVDYGPGAFIGRWPTGRSAQKVRIRHMNHVVASRLPDALPRRLPLEVKRALLWQCHAFRSLHFFPLSGKRSFFFPSVVLSA